MRLGGIVGTLAALTIVWYVFAPAGLGGGTSYAIVDGTSMQPHLRAGDLVLVRGASHYRVGEVVAYRDVRLGVTVLHRIIGRTGGRFITKGDNNAFTDPERPTPGQILGRKWLTVPGAGRLLGQLRRPLTAALAAGLLSLLMLLGGSTRRRRRSRGHGEQPGGPAVVLAAGAFALVAAGAVAMATAAFLVPAHRHVSRPDAYRQSGSVSYAARVAPSIAYPGGDVKTGDALYRRLVTAVRARFDYTFASNYRHDLTGTAWFSARLSDGNGWQHTLPLGRAVHFRGDRAHVTALLDLRRLAGITRAFEQFAGAPGGVYALTLAAHVDAGATVGGRPTDVRFVQRVDFTLDPARLLLNRGPSVAVAGAPLVASSSGSEPTIEATRLALGPIAIAVAPARHVAPAIAAVALLALAALIPALVRRAYRDPHERALRRHAARLLPIDFAPAMREDAIGVRSLDDLASLAGSPDTRILVTATPTGTRYFLHADGIRYTYFHRVAPLLASAAVNPARPDEHDGPDPLQRLVRLNRRRMHDPLGGS